jgi:hypothetical protein
MPHASSLTLHACRLKLLYICNKARMKTPDIIGSIGVGILLVAFVLNMVKLIKTTDRSYSILNFCGAALACYASWLIHYIPFVILEGAWTVVSLVAVFKGLRREA